MGKKAKSARHIKKMARRYAKAGAKRRSLSTKQRKS